MQKSDYVYSAVITAYDFFDINSCGLDLPIVTLTFHESFDADDIHFFFFKN